MQQGCSAGKKCKHMNHAGHSICCCAHSPAIDAWYEQLVSDPWLKDLAPDRFANTAGKNPYLDVKLRWQDGYDHTLAFFVAVSSDNCLDAIVKR